MLRAIAGAAEYGRFIAQAAACVVVLCRDTKYYLEDGCNASENMLVAARAHGLGSCWVAGDKKAYAETIRKLVGAPETCKLISLLAIGHAAEERVAEKRPLSDVLHWEKY
jgi:nitroreductase